MDKKSVLACAFLSKHNAARLAFLTCILRKGWNQLLNGWSLKWSAVFHQFGGFPFSIHYQRTNHDLQTVFQQKLLFKLLWRVFVKNVENSSWLESWQGKNNISLILTTCFSSIKLSKSYVPQLYASNIDLNWSVLDRYMIVKWMTWTTEAKKHKSYQTIPKYILKLSSVLLDVISSCIF